jgi:hypothetical protein
MAFEKIVLNAVKSVTSVPAYFYEGTLFLETQDSKIATLVFNALQEEVTCAISFGKCGTETSYDFLIGVNQ